MKRKWLLGILAIAMTTATAVGVSACGENDNGENSSNSSVFDENSSPEISSSVEDSSSEIIEDSSSESSKEEYPEDYYTEGLVFTLQGYDTYAVKGYTGTETQVVIPSVYNGKSVTSIKEKAFSECKILTKVVIPGTVTSIGNWAFFSCDSLTEILVDENNTAYKSIDGHLYSKDGKTLIQYAVGKTATLFTIPDGVTSIAWYAFRGCSSLTEIVIPDSVTSIGGSAFSNCNSLTEIVIPNSVTSIGYETFYNCYNLTEIVIPDSVTSIDERAFFWCKNLTIYCEAESEPSGWHYLWNCSCPVVWGYKGE